MEGMLCLWALSLQEFDFEIEYCKGTANSNANAFYHCPSDVQSQPVTATTHQADMTGLRQAQLSDPTIAKIHQCLSCTSNQPQGKDWKCQPLLCY